MLAGEVRIYEGDALIAAHPVLERPAPDRDRPRASPPANSDTPRHAARPEHIVPVAPATSVARRPLEFYAAVGRRLAGQGHPGMRAQAAGPGTLERVRQHSGGAAHAAGA